MKRFAKAWLITATVCVTLGLLLFAGAMAALGFDFSKLSTVKYAPVTHELIDDFDSISVDMKDADVILMPSEDDRCKVVSAESEKLKSAVTVTDGTLTISANDSRKWYEHIGINLESPEITIYLPKSEYSSLFIHTSTGDITLSDGFSFGSIEVTVSTGDVTLDGVTASDSISVETSTGDVELHGCDAPEIFIKTSTGDVEGTLLTGKEFIADSSTGSVDVPKSTTDGRCEIRTSTGDIEIEIK